MARSMSTRNAVTIPESLAQQLDAMGNHFLLITGKEAREKEWNTPQNLMKSNDPRLLAWLKNGGNYGVAGGAGVTIVEADTPEVVERMKQLPAKTFMVRSGGKGFPHYYLKCSTEGNHPLKIWENNPATDMGYIKAESGYVVGPNSIHPDTGNPYEVICDAEMLQTSSKFLYTLLDSWIRKKSSTLFKPNLNNRVDIPIASVISLDGLTDCGGGECRGPHPFHKSTTGWNFRVDLNENTWRCWACDTGGNGLSLFAIKEGIIKCGEHLQGQKFKEAVKKARTQGLLSRKTFWDFCEEVDGKQKFIPPLFADFLMENDIFKTPRKTSKGETSIYVYNPNSGIYTETGVDLIEEEMAQIFNEQNRKRYYPDVEFHIKGKTKFNLPEIDEPEIACLNGLLNPSNNELTDFTPDKFVTIQIPVTYIPNLKCPKIVKVITEILGEDGLNPFQEFLGYCLYNRYKFHRALLLIGDGENGKSTLINLIIRFLGKNNVANLSLQEICDDRFAGAELYGKLANLFADLPDKALDVTGAFKTATGGDSKSHARKFKTFLTFENRAKFLFSCNKIPETADDSVAFFRRWILLPCPNRFPPKKANPHILDDVCTPTEMSGLLNWALEGLQRLLKNGTFTEAESVAEKRTQWFRGANTAKAFIDENLDSSTDPQDYIYDIPLYNTYVHWCRTNKLKARMKGQFTQLMSAHFGIHRVQKRMKFGSKEEYEKRVKAWPYIRDVTTVTTLHINAYKNEMFLIESKRRSGDNGATDETEETFPSTCFLCHQALPSDQAYCTTLDGKTAHEACARKLKA